MQKALRKSARAFLVATLLILALSASALAQDDATGQLSPEAAAIVSAINSVRAENGLAPLRVHAQLNQAAQAHVDDLIANNMYGHYGSDGSSVRTRVARTGYPSQWVSENWVTSGSAAGAMAWWMNDWIHRVNILEDNWDEVGIGAGLVANGYWIFVTDFADADGAAQMAAQPAAQVAAAAPEISSVPAGGQDYTIKGGDTLLAIGLRFGIEWQDIALANNMGEGALLQIGAVIRLPGAGAAVAAAAADLPAGGKRYTVSSGDTLVTIASRHGIAWEDVAAANGISDPSLLQIGMQLRLPGVEEEGVASEETSAGESNDAEEPAAAQETGAYTVQSGDTLFGIAADAGMGWEELAELNGLGKDAVLQIGQSLQVPGQASASQPASSADSVASAAPAASAAPVAAAEVASAPINYTTELMNAAPALKAATGGAAAAKATYTVKAGDTVISIAVRANIGWKRLLEINGLDDNSLIQPGQVLVLE